METAGHHDRRKETSARRITDREKRETWLEDYRVLADAPGSIAGRRVVFRSTPASGQVESTRRARTVRSYDPRLHRAENKGQVVGDLVLAGVCVLLMALTAWLQGCGSWQNTMHRSLDVAHETGKIAHGVVGADFCGAAVSACKEARVINADDKCPGLDKCQQLRRRLVEKYLPAIQRAVLIGLMALQADKQDKNKIRAAVTAAVGAVGLVQESLLDWGLKL